MSADDPRDVFAGQIPGSSNGPDGQGRADAASAAEAARVWDALGAYPDEPVPPGFAERVMERVLSIPESAAEGVAEGASTVERTPMRVLEGGRFRGLAIAASLVAALGAGMLLSPRFLVREVVSAPAPTAALEAVPADLLDNEGLVSLASLPDADFEALLLADAEALDAR